MNHLVGALWDTDLLEGRAAPTPLLGHGEQLHRSLKANHQYVVLSLKRSVVLLPLPLVVHHVGAKATKTRLHPTALRVVAKLAG